MTAIAKIHFWRVRKNDLIGNLSAKTRTRQRFTGHAWNMNGGEEKGWVIFGEKTIGRGERVECGLWTGSP
jgi:hypothetical protein